MKDINPQIQDVQRTLNRINEKSEARYITKTENRKKKTNKKLKTETILRTVGGGTYVGDNLQRSSC